MTACDALLADVCARLGFCGSVVDDQPLSVDQFIPKNGVVTADGFADALFKAEGWDPSGLEAQKHRLSVMEAFARHFGTSEVEARLLR